MKIGSVYYLLVKSDTPAKGITLTLRRIHDDGAFGTLNVLGFVVGTLRVKRVNFDEHWRLSRRTRERE